jgi:hypothetical protein
MAYTWDKDILFTGGVSAGVATAIFELKSFLTGTTGWTVNASGTGVNSASYSASGDLILSATQLNSTNAWFKLKMSGSNREFTFQRTTTHDTWRIKYAPLGFITSGSTTGSFNSTPHGTSEFIICGAGSDASPAGSSLPQVSTDAMRAHIIAQNTSPFGWSMVCHRSGNASIQEFMIFLDPLLSGTYSNLDPDPYVAGVGRSTQSGFIGSTLGMSSETSNTTTQCGVVSGSNTPFAIYTGAVIVTDAGTNQQFAIPAGLGTNPFSGMDDLFLVPWIRRGNGIGNAPGGFKGFSNTFTMPGSNRASASTFTISSSMDYYLYNQIAVPWDGTVPNI